jgi:hypothetical protein
MAAGGGVAMDVRVHETVRLELTSADGTETVAITLERKDGQVARLRIQAPQAVRICKPARREFLPAA